MKNDVDRKIQFSLVLFKYTPTEPVILPSKPINRPLKTDWYNGTTYNRLF